MRYARNKKFESGETGLVQRHSEEFPEVRRGDWPGVELGGPLVHGLVRQVLGGSFRHPAGGEG